MDKFNGQSMDIEQAERDKLQALFPQCFSEGKLDIDKLLNLCGEYIDNDFEKYKFEWSGKAECYRIAGKRSTGTLRPSRDESVNWDATRNLYIEGDNLEVLKLLQTAYFRKVKMIYIDPPYNTGNDFVYADDFRDPISRYKEVTQQTTKSNPETMGRYHTNWLNMMFPRLRLAANLLRDDGVIFISIDDNEVHNLRKLCDEVFGEENFVDTISWFKKASPSNDAQYFSNDVEYILVYAKTKSTWQPNRLPLTEKQMEYYQNPDNDPRGGWNSATYTCNKSRSERPNLYYPIMNPFTGQEVWPKETAVWKYSKEQCDEHIKDKLLFWGVEGTANFPRFKKLLTGHQGVVNRTLWHYDDVSHTQGASEELKQYGIVGFATPKPTRLIKKMLQIATDPNDNDIILDFFSGSATTAHAVMQLNAEDGGNRRYIMVQLPEICDENSEAYKAGYKNICEIGKERIRRAGAKILESSGQVKLGDEDNPPLDVGFRCFKLDSSNLVAWDATPISDGGLQTLWDRFDALSNTLKAGRSDMDIVFEVMLKMGVPLDFPVLPITVGDKKAYSIGEGCMILVCLDSGLTPEDIEAMCDLAPAKIIAAEEGFTDDTALSNAHYILKDRDIEMKLL
ncbi:MAG: site-specific DNA-methyltransferase [Clostridiales bacterium]|nr:site-specific DNA-methyltransferase [Clostridiales bacterium]